MYSIRQRLGVVAVICPFNFPAMVPLWFVPVAIACGNAVVLKPSEKDPSAAIAIAALWREAGLPDGVLNVVNGDKEAVDALLEHPDVQGGVVRRLDPDRPVRLRDRDRAGKRVQALGGAKNHMVVLPDADLDLAADAAVNAGFGSAGERCMAISALVAVDAVADELVERIADRMGELRTGDGPRGCDMGPLVTAAHRDKVRPTWTPGWRRAPSWWWTGGTRYDADGDGVLLAPDAVRPGDPGHVDLHRRDLRAGADRGPGGSYDEGLELVNANPYGNGTAIFTNDGGAARRFQHEVEVGMVGINVPIPVPVAYYSFGGWKNSLFGDTHAHGDGGVHFFTRGKVVTSRWLDPSHGGVNSASPRTTVTRPARRGSGLVDQSSGPGVQLHREDRHGRPEQQPLADAAEQGLADRGAFLDPDDEARHGARANLLQHGVRGIAVGLAVPLDEGERRCRRARSRCRAGGA